MAKNIMKQLKRPPKVLSSFIYRAVKARSRFYLDGELKLGYESFLEAIIDHKIRCQKLKSTKMY